MNNIHPLKAHIIHHRETHYEMKPLQLTFEGRGEVSGYTFTQMPESIVGEKYIYKLESEGHTHYEVFLHKENSQFDCVSYPKSNSFGIWAWCAATYERAMEIFEKLEYVEPKIKQNL